MNEALNQVVIVPSRGTKILHFVLGFLLSTILSIGFTLVITDSGITEPLFGSNYSTVEDLILPAFGGILIPLVLYFVLKNKKPYIAYGTLAALVAALGFAILFSLLLSSIGGFQFSYIVK